jgi:hypothetical protein
LGTGRKLAQSQTSLRALVSARASLRNANLPKIETSHNRPIPTPSTISLRLFTALTTAPLRTPNQIINAAATYTFIAPVAYKPFILLSPLGEAALQPFKRTSFASGYLCDPKGPHVIVVALVMTGVVPVVTLVALVVILMAPLVTLVALIVALVAPVATFFRGFFRQRRETGAVAD